MAKMVLFLTLGLTPFVYAKMSVSDTGLKNFKPGNYELKKGDLSQCGDGKFYLRDHSSNVAFGYLHGFETVPKSESLPGDAPGDEQCTNFGDDRVEAGDTETRLIFSEVRKCKNKSRHKLQKTAIVQAGLIKMDVRQTGEDGNFSYSCTWKLKSKGKR